MVNQNSINTFNAKSETLGEIDRLTLSYLFSEQGSTANEIAHFIAQQEGIKEESIRNSGSLTRLFKQKKVGRGDKRKCSITGNVVTTHYAITETNIDYLEIYDETTEEVVITDKDVSDDWFMAFLKNPNVKSEYKTKFLDELKFQVSITGTLDMEKAKDKVEMYTYMNGVK